MLKVIQRNMLTSNGFHLENSIPENAGGKWWGVAIFLLPACQEMGSYSAFQILDGMSLEGKWQIETQCYSKVATLKEKMESFWLKYSPITRNLRSDFSTASDSTFGQSDSIFSFSVATLLYHCISICHFPSNDIHSVIPTLRARV